MRRGTEVVAKVGTWLHDALAREPSTARLLAEGLCKVGNAAGELWKAVVVELELRGRRAGPLVVTTTADRVAPVEGADGAADRIARRHDVNVVAAVDAGVRVEYVMS